MRAFSGFQTGARSVAFYFAFCLTMVGRAELPPPSPHGFGPGTQPPVLERAMVEDLVPPATALDCSMKSTCPTTHTPATCAMEELYRKDLYGHPQRVDANISVTDDNYCVAMQRVCEIAARVKFQPKERPIYCFEPADRVLASKRGPGFGQVELMTAQIVDLRRVKSELKDVGLLGVVSIDDHRFTGQGLTLFARTDPGEEHMLCESVKANRFLRSTIQGCTSQAARTQGIGEIETVVGP